MCVCNKKNTPPTQSKPSPGLPPTGGMAFSGLATFSAAFVPDNTPCLGGRWCLSCSACDSVSFCWGSKCLGLSTEEVEALGWLSAFQLVLDGLRVVPALLWGGCETPPSPACHKLFCFTAGSQGRAKSREGPGVNPRAGSGHQAGRRGDLPPIQPQNLPPGLESPEGTAIPPPPAQGRLCGSRSLQVPLAPSLCACWSHWDAAEAPPRRAECGSWGWDPILSPSLTVTCLPLALQAGTAGDNGQVDVTNGFVPLQQKRTPRARRLLPPVTPRSLSSSATSS